MKKGLIVFDLDGTLTETKRPMDAEMAGLLRRLLLKKKVAVIGGGSRETFQSQFVDEIGKTGNLRNLYLFPTNATTFYRYHGGWKSVYRQELPPKDKRRIKEAFRAVLGELRYVPPKKTYGEVIEDRGTQVTFSALGQDVVASLGAKGVRLKKAWTKKNTPLKLKIAKLVQKRLPEFEARAAGFTSIDITRKGIDKAYGIRQIEKYLKIPKKEMIFIGDALFPGGNDYAVKKTGVASMKTSGPEETKKIIKRIIEGKVGMK